MKEATGELNMTVVTLIAIAAIGTLFYFVIWPMIEKMIVQQTCNTYGDDWTARRQTADAATTQGSADVNEWLCCPGTATTVAGGCIQN